MAFRDDVRRILQDGGGSVYEAIVGLSLNRLPGDADQRYQYLRSPQGRFIARDEGDVDVYVSKVANLHVPKFKWLYRSLFKSYQATFSKDVDLVIWGCGCGLDLAAFYDCALEQKNPQLWTRVRHITLIDASSAALERAVALAQALFPLAKGNVISVVCDLTNPNQVASAVRLRQLNAYLPRVHLISNFLDLVPDAVEFARSVKSASARTHRGIGHNIDYYNELMVAFSPAYQWGRVAVNMEVFRRTWGETFADSIQTVGDAPLNCEFCAFTYCTLAHIAAGGTEDKCFRSYMGGRNRALNMMVGQCPEMTHNVDFHALVTALARIKIGEKNFFRQYGWSEAGRFHGVLERFVFVAKPDISEKLRPCVVEMVSPAEGFDDDSIQQSASRALSMLKNRCSDGLGFPSAEIEDFLVLVWNGTNLISPNNHDLTALDTWIYNGTADFSLYFRIDPGDAEPLPDCETKMDEVQREVIYSRAQYRKVRGGAGCGKSTTMMWHAVMAALRTQLPVLLVCRTVTLFSRNAKRMAATILKEVPGLECVDRSFFKFMTLNKVLCEHASQKYGKCLWRRCSKCKGCAHDPCVDCTDYSDVGNDWRKLSEAEKNKCCDACTSENIRLLDRKGSKYAQDMTVYGAVLIDEVQSVNPDLVQAVVNLTFGGNPARECYVFCDERQSLNPAAVEIDPEKGKLRVKVPDRGVGYGRWVNLNKPYRTSDEFSGRLTDVAMKLQAMTIEKYGAVELAKIIAGGQMDFSANGVFAIRKSTQPLMTDVLSEIAELGETGPVTVICDTPDSVRTLLRCPESKGWLSTHAESNSHAKEQELRLKFSEVSQGVHLTTVMLAQGWDFQNVVYVCEKEREDQSGNVLENVLTGATRARSRMRILDRSISGWLYNELSGLNS